MDCHGLIAAKYFFRLPPNMTRCANEARVVMEGCLCPPLYSMYNETFGSLGQIMRRSGKQGGDDARRVLMNKLGSDAFKDIQEAMEAFLKYYERAPAELGR